MLIKNIVMKSPPTSFCKLNNYCKQPACNPNPPPPHCQTLMSEGRFLSKIGVFQSNSFLK